MIFISMQFVTMAVISITDLFIVRLEAVTGGGLKIHKKRVRPWHGMVYL